MFQVPIQHFFTTEEATAADLVNFSPSPASLNFQLTLSEKECFASTLLPQQSANPVSLRCFKPENHQETISIKVTEYIPPMLSCKNDLKEVLVVDKDDLLLELSFKIVKFLHHPLFSLEHFLVKKLQEFYENYKKFEPGQCRTVKEAKRLKKLLLQQAKLQKKILKCWSVVKKVRKEQNYSNTALRLVISTKGYQTFSQFLDEIVQINDLQLDEPILDLILVENELKTPEKLEERESLRRKVVQTTKFTLKILCDGVLVAKTDPEYLTNDFELDFCQTFPIRLSRPPKWFTVELYEHPKG